jgi:hypothetical protein
MRPSRKRSAGHRQKIGRELYAAFVHVAYSDATSPRRTSLNYSHGLMAAHGERSAGITQRVPGRPWKAALHD